MQTLFSVRNYTLGLGARSFMRLFTSAVLAVYFFSTNALAEGPLPPGKPAGVSSAVTIQKKELYVFAGVGLVLAGAGIAIVGGDKSNPASSSSSTAP